MADYKWPKGYTQYGANMGRMEYNRPPKGARTIRLFRVSLIAGYDNGGAYWGGGETLWCAMADTDETGLETYRAFARANTRRKAMKALGLTITQLVSKKDI